MPMIDEKNRLMTRMAREEPNLLRIKVWFTYQIKVTIRERERERERDEEEPKHDLQADQRGLERATPRPKMAREKDTELRPKMVRKRKESKMWICPPRIKNEKSFTDLEDFLRSNEEEWCTLDFEKGYLKGLLRQERGCSVLTSFVVLYLIESL
ncbi:hypothetical protein V8G54_036671 [Vigna mungo]|uniref:Uncharacterized protein n=1 Tax=Vigna mungo TaxID=3915 RepID=A0AAQ3MHI1_VIGMU